MASENPHKSDDNSVPRIRVNKWVVYGAIAVVALIVSFILRRVDLELLLDFPLDIEYPVDIQYPKESLVVILNQHVSE